ncbi:MAG: PAS domain S-box protein [Candidatus Bathyarchaeia archaeon]
MKRKTKLAKPKTGKRRRLSRGEKTHYQADLLEKAFNSVTDAIFLLDARNPPTILECNKAATQIFGYPKAEMLGRTMEFLQVSDQAFREFQSKLYPVMKQNHLPYRLPDYKMKRKNGTVFPSAHVVSELVDDRGVRTGWVSVVGDITERKRIEDEHRATRDRLEFLISSTPIVIYTCKPYGDYGATFVSQNVTSQLGYTPEEWTKDPKFWVNHLHPEDRQRVLDGLSSLFTKGYHVHEYRFQHKDGTYTRIQDEMKLIRDESGNPAEVVGYWVDVTKRDLMDGGRRKYGLSIWKRAEHLEDAVEYRTRALIESEARYRILVENIPERIFAKDRNSVYVSCNNRFAQDLNIRPDQIRGKTDYDFYPRELADSYQTVDKRVMESGKVEEVEEKYVAHGSEFIVDTIKTPLRDSGGNVSGVIGIFRDITERKKMEKRLAESQRLAAIGETAAMVAHDLRNPLQGIVGAAYNIREHLRNAADPSVQQMLAIIDKGVGYANGIISDLLEFSREMPLQLLPTTPKSIVRQALKDVKVPDTIRVEDTTTVGTEILVDEAKIRRVLTNLIQNAIDAMPEGGRLSISSLSSPREVSISVTDTGTGIPPDHMEKIWTPLYTTKSRGIGLGLPICKRIVEAHGGSISVVSTAGRGSTFTVKFPTRPKEEGERR